MISLFVIRHLGLMLRQLIMVILWYPTETEKPIQRNLGLYVLNLFRQSSRFFYMPSVKHRYMRPHFLKSHPNDLVRLWIDFIGCLVWVYTLLNGGLFLYSPFYWKNCFAMCYIIFLHIILIMNLACTICLTLYHLQFIFFIPYN